MEDFWSPTAPFRSLKILHQLDFVGAFPQANVRGRIFISLPNVYGYIWPEFKDYCGRPLRLAKSICFFFKVFPDGSYVKLIVNVDDKLLFGNYEATLQEFKNKPSNRFDTKLLEQTRWY
jgi:hypothetical protein